MFDDRRRTHNNTFTEYVICVNNSYHLFLLFRRQYITKSIFKGLGVASIVTSIFKGLGVASIVTSLLLNYKRTIKINTHNIYTL